MMTMSAEQPLDTTTQQKKSVDGEEEVVVVENEMQRDSSFVDVVHHEPSEKDEQPQEVEDTSTQVEISENLDDIKHQGDVIDPAVLAFMLTQLACQLEYYLSVKNLSKDTYVQTLRNLNDGCIPVSILASFTKVKGILLAGAGIVDESSRSQAVLDAASQYSSKLRVVHIDTKTGKTISDTDSNEDGLAAEDSTRYNNAIVAIGTMDNEPIAILSEQPSLPVTSDFANAIVMRDVAPEVTAEEIYALFQYEGCPPVICITPDVANCWFVELDTASRSDVMAVLLQLRCETLAGYPVHARIKTSVAASSVPIDPAPLMTDWQTDQQQMEQNGKKKSDSPEQGRRKKKNKSKKKSNNNSNKKGSSSPASSPNTTSSGKKTIVPPPPILSEDNFPTLQDNRVEWGTTTPIQDEEKNKEEQPSSDIIVDKEKMEDDEDIKNKLCSDSASTATTTSSSTEPGPKKTGYAAAVKTMKADESTTSNSNDSLKAQDCPDPESSDTVITQTKQMEGSSTERPKTPVVQVKPPAWGRGRSFAEILRQAQTASS